MVQAYHGISDFIAQVKKTDFARSNRFEVLFNYPEIMQSHYTSQGESPKLISMMVEDVIFPGLLVGTRAYRLNNLNYPRATSIDFGGDSISMTFLVDASWTVKDFFGDWMRKIVNPVTRYVEYPDAYVADIDLVALNNKDEVVVHWRIEGAFPRSLAPIQASGTNAQVLRLPVTFTYKNWRAIGGYDPEGNPMQFSAEGDPDEFVQDITEDDTFETI